MEKETIYFPIEISCTGTTGWSILNMSGLKHPPKKGPYLIVENGKLNSYGDPDGWTADEQTLQLVIPPTEEPDTTFYHLGKHNNTIEEPDWEELKKANARLIEIVDAVRSGARRGW